MSIWRWRPWPLRGPVRVALFVDYDNVAPSVKRFELVDRVSNWLAWIERGAYQENDGRKRKLVIKNCYWNSHAERYRSIYEAAGFSVTATPSRTKTPKSSADIAIAIDAIDALFGPKRIDEIIILSSDSDFTPLAERLKDAGRIVTVFADEHAVPAYRDVADTVIDAKDLFMAARAPDPPLRRGPLRKLARRLGLSTPRPKSFDLDALAIHFVEDLKARDGTVMAAKRLRRLCASVAGFELEGPTAWFGCGDINKFSRAVVSRHPDLDLYQIDQERMTFRLAPGVKAEQRAPMRRRKRSAASVDLDLAAARLAEAAKVAQHGAIGRRGVRNALAMFFNAGPDWLGLGSYRAMLEALAARRADLNVAQVDGGGVVLEFDEGDEQSEKAFDRALQVLAASAFPLPIDEFFAVMATPAPHQSAFELDARGRERLLKRLSLAGLVIDEAAEPAVISDPHHALAREVPRLPAPDPVPELADNDPDEADAAEAVEVTAELVDEELAPSVLRPRDQRRARPRQEPEKKRRLALFSSRRRP